MILTMFLRSLIRQVELTLTDVNGVTHRMGDPATGPVVHIRLHDRKLHTKIWVDPRLYVGEAYMNGTLTVEHSGMGGRAGRQATNCAAAEVRQLASALGRGWRP